MSSPSNSSPPSIGRSANRALTPSLTTHDRSISHGAATVSSQQANLRSDGDNDSISSQGARKRDKFLNLFRSAKPEEKAKTQVALSETKIHEPPAAGTQARDAIDYTGSIIKVSSPETRTQLTIDKRRAVFSENMNKTSTRIAVPKLGARIDTTSQLALCISLLPRNPALPPHSCGLEGTSDFTKEASHNMPTGGAEQEWIEALEKNPVKQGRIRWLGSRIVEEFIKDPLKDKVTVSEVILLGSVLGQGHYRKLVTCFIMEFEKSILFNVDLLQGLIQLVQCASPTYLAAGDLIKILSILRIHLGGTHQQSPHYQYHLTLAVSRLLDVMADPKHKVKDLPRVEESEPLTSVLSGLQTSADPYLMYQAQYAFQALQYVPDDESAVHAVLRHSLGAAESLIKVSGVIQLNFGGLFEGLQEMQKTIEETYGIAKSGYEGVRSLIDSGRGLFDSLREGLFAGHKLPWYPAILGATAFLQAGQLEELGKLIREAPCRRDPRFQWGICQLLGEIAVDPIWETGTREQAINFLEDLYRNDPDWGQDDSVKSWMLTILGKISETPDHKVKEIAYTLLQVLKKNGTAMVMHPYPLRSHLPIPMSSPLLALVQEIPYVEDDLDSLRLQRLQEYDQTVYIPPQAKVNLQASDKDTQPLMEKVNKFLNSDGQVFLVLGDSGAGKSTFNRHLEHELWKEYKQEGRIPLFINLPAIHEPYHDMIDKQLRINKFSEAKIKEMKQHRQMILICDGYDETQLQANLHTANMLNQKGQADTKMIISCRSTYLGQDYRDQFQPQLSDRYSVTAANLFTEAVIVPFTSDQIEDYVVQYVRDPEVHKLIGDRPIWSTKDYMNRLRSIPNLIELAKNPFLLSLSLRALPDVVKDAVDLAKIKVTRLTLYNSFIDQWLEINKRRLRTSKHSVEAEKALRELLEEGFTTSAIDFLKDLAAAIFREQDGNPVVQYTPRSDKGTWKIKFFGPGSDIALLRESSPLSRAGLQHRFIHHSLLEYFYSRYVYETIKTKGVLSEVSGDLADHPLSQRNLVKEPSIVQFLAEHVQGDSAFKQRLHQIIERSKTDGMASQAAANAITILVRAGVLFNMSDLRGIQIPNADLSGGQFDSAQLQGADLRNANLRNIWLRQADLSNAQMAGVEFGEWPFLQEDSPVIVCTYCSNGNTCAVGLQNGAISLYDSSNWEKIHTLEGHISAVTSVAFSPTGEQIASGSNDGTVRLWDAEPSQLCRTLYGHTDLVNSVAYSPNGDQVVSGSADNTVRLWDTRTGQLCRIIKGHRRSVESVVYSPIGDQIASGSNDCTVQLHDTRSGRLLHLLLGHTDLVSSVAYSPTGEHIASGSYDRTVRLWDARSGRLRHLLLCHTDLVNSVAYSPTGEQIATGSDDDKVRLWDAQTGQLYHILDGHNNKVNSVAYSPTGEQIASGSNDKTVRLWDARIGQFRHALHGHTDKVIGVAYSPTGKHIASRGEDDTVRLWDAQTGQLRHTLDGHNDTVNSLAYSPTSKHIASRSEDDTVRLCDQQIGQLRHTLDGPYNTINGVANSPTGEQIASGSNDRTVRLWDVDSGQLRHTLDDHTDAVSSPISRQVTSDSNESKAQLRDAETDLLRHTSDVHKSFSVGVAYSPTGEHIASRNYDMMVQLWDARSGQLLHLLLGHTDLVNSVVYSPTGDQIASSSNDRTVRLWDAQTGQLRHTLDGHSRSVESVAYSPLGDLIASGSNDSTVRLWDARSGQLLHLLLGHTDLVNSVAYSPTGEQIASGSNDRTVRLWDAQTGQLLHTLDGHDNAVNSVAYSPIGKQIVSGSNDMTARLWDTEAGQLVHTLDGHNGAVFAVAYSPSGKQITSGGWDKTVRLWDTVSGHCLALIQGFNGAIYSIALKMSIDGYYLVTGCEDKFVRLWKVTEEANHCQVCLRWTSGHTTLTVSDTYIQDVQGLSRIHMRLLQQRGAVGEPIPPSSSREASRELIGVTSVVSKRKMLSNHSTLHTFSTANFPAVQSTKLVGSLI